MPKLQSVTFYCLTGYPGFLPSVPAMSTSHSAHSFTVVFFSSWVIYWVPLIPLRVQSATHHSFYRHPRSEYSSKHHQAFIIYPCNNFFNSPTPLQQHFFLVNCRVPSIPLCTQAALRHPFPSMHKHQAIYSLPGINFPLAHCFTTYNGAPMPSNFIPEIATNPHLLLS